MYVLRTRCAFNNLYRVKCDFWRGWSVTFGA